MQHLSPERCCIFRTKDGASLEVCSCAQKKIVRVRKRKKSLVVANHGFAVTHEALCRNPCSGIRISPTLLHQTGLTH